MSASETAVRTAIGRWNAGDLDGYLELYDPAIRLHGYAPQPMDKAAVAGFYRMIGASLPAAGKPMPELVIDDLFSAGADVCCRFTMTGSHSGPFMGVPATGRAYVLAGITILRFAGPRVIERWSNADMLGLLVQIGAVPTPG